MSIKGDDSMIKLDYTIAVSYTHLDVYKRQGLDKKIALTESRGKDFYFLNC